MDEKAFHLFLNKEGSLLFFGSGVFCENVLRWFSVHNYTRPVAICDNHVSKHGTEIDGIPVISFESALKQYPDMKILITSKKYGSEIEGQIGDKLMFSFSEERIYDYYKNLDPAQYEEILKDWYLFKTGEVLNLEHPKTFNEKIQWLKLYDSTPLKTRLADKYLVREWIKEQIGEEYLIPLLGVWDSFDDIDFDTLPEQFALKTNHGCGWNYIVTDKSKMNLSKMKEDFNKWMDLNYTFCGGLEFHYKDIVPKILAEEYIQNIDDLYDYKLMCFHGKVNFLWVCSGRGRELKRSFFDINYQLLPISFLRSPVETDLEKPETLKNMIRLAQGLSEGFPCVRVDFYEINGKLYFGEMTFTSESGCMNVEPEHMQVTWGDLIHLPKIK